MFKPNPDLIPALIQEITAKKPVETPRGSIDVAASIARKILGEKTKSKEHVLHIVEFIRKELESGRQGVLCVMNEQTFKMQYHKYLKENAVAANAVGGGAVAGMGVGAQGEPGVKTKKKTKNQIVLGMYRRAMKGK